jgi:hypothetical protein
LNAFLVSITVFLTIVVAMIIGIGTAYGTVTGILIAFGHHSQSESIPASLAQAESRASGD